MLRRTSRAILILLAGASASSSWACGNCDELGHHWHLPAYRGEMWLQSGVMIGAAVLFIAGRLILRARRRRSEQQ